MSEMIQELEEKLRRLLNRLDSLEAENKAFRSIAGGRDEQLSGQEVIGQIEELRQQKRRLEQKISLFQKEIERILVDFDSLEI